MSLTVETDGKKASVTFWSSGGLSVCALNASARRSLPAGHRFENVEDALAGYKSGEMKANIRAAASEFERHVSEEKAQERDFLAEQAAEIRAETGVHPGILVEA